MKYMLDTNFCIYAIKKKPDTVLERLHREIDSGICISSITLAELQFGVEKSLFPEKNTAALGQFLVALNVLSFDDQAAVEYGRICAYLQKRGTTIGTMDMLIAAHAKAADLTLVTNNTREFARVPYLALDNWT